MRRIKGLLKIVLTVLFIFFASVLLSVATRTILTSSVFTFSEESAALITSIIEGAVGALSIGFVVYQLMIGNDAEARQNDIEEAKFLLQLNQTFIQDPNMYMIEHNLEYWMEHPNDDKPLITEDNLQSYINYLVYMEGFAPLIMKGILSLDVIDNLLAYRFFIAVNNPVLQKNQLFPYADYYKGCFMLYKKWKQYRLNKGEAIPLIEYSLDKWEFFDIYTMEDVYVSDLSYSDNFKEVASLIYGTDPFIYPTAFENEKRARQIIPHLIKEQNGLFSKNNILVARVKRKVVGMIVFADDATDASYFPDNLGFPESFSDVNKEYFSHIHDMITDQKTVYLACICVDRSYHGKHIGGLMLQSFINRMSGKDIILDVIADNIPAIKLYEKFGFVAVEEKDGYSYKEKPPKVISMIYHGNKAN